jgi:hypothetical protein
MHTDSAFKNLMLVKIYIHPYQHAQRQLIFFWVVSVSVSQLGLPVHFGYHSPYLALEKAQTDQTFYMQSLINQHQTMSEKLHQVHTQNYTQVSTYNRAETNTSDTNTHSSVLWHFLNDELQKPNSHNKATQSRRLATEACIIFT